jgi:hypothetical protein
MDTTKNLINMYGRQTKLIVHGAGTSAFEVLSRHWAGTEQNNDTVIVPFADKNDLHKIVALLDERQIKYDELELKKSSLEDVFLDLTAVNHEEVLETIPDLRRLHQQPENLF